MGAGPKRAGCCDRLRRHSPVNTGNGGTEKNVFHRSRSGVGSALLRFLEEAASALGYREIALETRRVNHKAVAFYKKHGYTVTDNYGAYIGRDDAVCFIKTL
jgi:RimJ/RimL family protein N-acetyltransferase